jgi:hypothetical protein
MLMFYGFDIELFIEAVHARRDGPTLCCACDACGDQWLIVEVDDDPVHLAWLCVPVSNLAMQAVVRGRAAPRDAIRHSATGTVELVAVDHGRAIPDSCLLCADIPEHLLPADDRPAMAAA